MIKIREDFEKFNDEFIEFSRDFHLMKWRVKAHQFQIKNKVKKLYEWNDVSSARM